MTPLLLDCRRLPGAALITVAGEVDATNSPQLEAFLAQARQDGCERLVLDLAELRFIDSSGLQVLIACHDVSRAHGGGLHLAALGPSPSRLLQITGLCAYFSVHDTVQDALAAAFEAA
ncbi:STAS domain-containing protein [Nonomuraea dietziae]|uniref:STAS domain-containing protein n=1 Tax=Nonomuraea dietziae TaxID=65515 RepID=UPI0033CCA9B8